MPEKNGKLLKVISFLFGIICITLCVFVFMLVYFEIRDFGSTFDTDESDHANPALFLYTALKQGDISNIYTAIVRQAFYPPLYSVFICINYFISGVSFYSSRMPSLYALIIYTFLLFLALKAALKDQSQNLTKTNCAFIAAIFAVTSPITITNSTLCMLELPGLVAVTICILIFLQRNIFLISAAALSVFFVKYNFGIISIPAAVMTIWITQSFKKAFISGFFISACLFIWSQITDLDSFIHFFRGHKSYAPMLSSENIFFELNAWINHYSLSPVLGVILLLLAILGIWKYKSKPTVVFAALNTFFSFFLLALSTTNEDRHFMVALPGILFLSGFGIYFLFAKLPAIRSIIASFIVLLCIVFLMILRLPDIKSDLKLGFEGEPGFPALFQEIYEQTGTDAPVIIYGISDSFSIEALRWYFAKSSGKFYTDINIDAYPYRDDKNFTAKKRKRNLDKPYSDPTFPKKPLQAVLNKSYYGYAVHILNTSKKQKFLKEGDEFKAVLSPKVKFKTGRGSHYIEIYKLLG